MHAPNWNWRLSSFWKSLGGGGGSHLPPNPNSHMGHFKLILELVEQLLGIGGTISPHPSISTHPQFPWIQAAPGGSWVIICIKEANGTVSFGPEVIERCQQVWQGGGEGVWKHIIQPGFSLESFPSLPFSFYCSLGRLMMNQEQPAPGGHTEPVICGAGAQDTPCHAQSCSPH